MLENYTEKKKMLKIEQSLRRFVSMQWENLRESILAPPMAPLVHPHFWGHKSRSWRKSLPHDRMKASEDNVYNQENILQFDVQAAEAKEHIPPPPILPPRGDNYSNKSRIITCQLYQDGDWQVEDEDCNDFLSESSTDESAMITVEAADVEIVQDDKEESDLSLGTPMGEGRGYLGMEAHPPPFLSVQEYENHVQELNSAHYDGLLYDEYENYEGDDGDDGEQEFDVDFSPTEVEQISEQDRYLAEFNAFYASYEEATHSTHREEDVPDNYQDEGNDDFEDERD